jgi:hypothetical protein
MAGFTAATGVTLLLAVASVAGFACLLALSDLQYGDAESLGSRR